MDENVVNTTPFNYKNMSKKTRCALMPFSGNPFLLYCIVQNFKNKWYDCVDKLYITTIYSDWCYRYPNYSDLIEEICKDDKIVYQHITQEEYHVESPFDIKKRTKLDVRVDLFQNDNPNVDLCSFRRCPHGFQLRKLFEISNEEEIVFFHDDFFIKDKKYLTDRFDWINSGKCDFTGILTGGCSQLEFVSKKAKENKLYRQVDYRGRNINIFTFGGPTSCGFFCKRSDLMETSLVFEHNLFPPNAKMHAFDCINETNENIYFDPIVYLYYEMLKNKKMFHTNLIEDDVGFYHERFFDKTSPLFNEFVCGAIHFFGSSFIHKFVPSPTSQDFDKLSISFLDGKDRFFNDISYWERTLYTKTAFYYNTPMEVCKDTGNLTLYEEYLNYCKKLQDYINDKIKTVDQNKEWYEDKKKWLSREEFPYSIDIDKMNYNLIKDYLL